MFNRYSNRDETHKAYTKDHSHRVFQLKKSIEECERKYLSDTDDIYLQRDVGFQRKPWDQ